MPMTIEQFGQEIKRKYPQYQNVPDAELGQQIITKYPQYQRVLSPEQPASISPEQAYKEPEQAKKKGILGQAVEAVAKPFTKTLATGAAAAESLGKLATSLPGGISQEEQQKINEAATKERQFGAFGSATPIGVSQEQAQQGVSGITSQPTGQAAAQFAKEVIGTGAELGSYFTPAAVGKGALTAATQGAKAAKATLPALARGGAVSGLLGGAGSAFAEQDSTLGDIVTRGALGTVTGGLAGGAIPGVGRAASTAGRTAKQAVGETVQNLPSQFINNLIRPGKKAFSFGKNPGDAIAKLGIIANSEDDLLQKIVQNKQTLGNQISQLINAPEIATKKIDVANALKPIDDAIKNADDIGEEALANRLVKMKDGLTQIFRREDGKLLPVASRKPQISPAEAFEIKKKIGQATKWTGQAFDSDVNQVRAKVYGNLKNAIEDATSGLPSDKSLRELNNLYGNLIEAESALQNRMVIAQRNNLVSLPDIGVAGVGLAAGGAPGAIAGVLAKKFIRSVAFRTRFAAILKKMTAEQKQVMDQIAPNIFPAIGTLPEKEAIKAIESLPGITTMIRNGLIQLTTQAENAAINPENTPRQ